MRHYALLILRRFDMLMIIILIADTLLIRHGDD